MNNGMAPLGELFYLRFGEVGMTALQAAGWLGIHERTYRRQERGQSRVSGPLWRALALKAGRLGEIHPAWSSWRLSPRDGRLYPPGYRYGLAAGEILAVPYLQALVAELQRQKREMACQQGVNGEASEALMQPGKLSGGVHNSGAGNENAQRLSLSHWAVSVPSETVESQGETDHAKSSTMVAGCPSDR